MGDTTGKSRDGGTERELQRALGDQSECADEVIHLPGSVQRHGFLLLLDAAGEHIVAASANAEEFLAVPLKLVLGTPIDTVLNRELLAVVRALAISDDSDGRMTYLGAFRLGEELCSVLTHRVGERRVLEFELLHRLIVPEIMNAVITNFVGKLSKLNTPLELCESITRQVRELTGFNRVLLYSFDEAGHGTVLAEENDGTLPSYLDLRFPASDVPEQARRLYVANTVRIIPNANYQPAPLVGVPSVNAAQLDLSYSTLRSVSPVHLEYMRNMGTISSMSISILCDGKLWGLISGHHATAHTVPYLVRSACDMLTKIVGTQLTAFRSAARLEKLVQFHAMQRILLTEMAADPNYLHALRRSTAELLKVTGATGAAVLSGGSLTRSATSPDEASIERIADWLDNRPELDLFETRNLSEHLPWATSIKEMASGLLAIRTSATRRSYILWFRPEVVQTVTWAGEPVKSRDAEQHLHPRSSFESWKETVFAHSMPWEDVEIESAWDFRSALMTISLKRAEEEAELSEQRFQQLTHVLPALVWTADDDGDLSYVNDRWRELGLPVHGRWYEAAGLHPEDMARLAAQWTNSLAGNQPFEEEVRLQRPGTPERWHLIRVVPFRARGGQRAGWVGTFTDMTDRREREAALRMTEKLATTGRMTSVIAHEINNPLESITNLMYLLRGELREDGPAREYISLAESELERISGITKQTLRWGRERSERVEPVSASALFDDILRLFAGKIRNRQVRVTRQDREPVSFEAVGGQIRQVLANLVSNAIDAAPVGGTVGLAAHAEGDLVTLAVSDNGAGMSAETRQQLFQPFFSTKGDLGNGLGLYISHEIVERHGGVLRCDSEQGKGTSMRVELPRNSRVRSAIPRHETLQGMGDPA